MLHIMIKKNNHFLQKGSLDSLHQVIEAAESILLGKRVEIRLALTCLLAKGHLLIEDVPGVGKTTLAKTLAHLLGLSSQRIQFTSDMLPADILGISIYRRSEEEFVFQPGPIFSHIVLADEINRATPKTQSALLEAMEERQVTIDGQTKPLSAPFLVVATQNPARQLGTFPLPESQLDRFLMRLAIGYPDELSEKQLLKGEDRREALYKIKPIMNAEMIQALQEEVSHVYASDAIIDYIQALVQETRNTQKWEYGLSPRSSLGLLHASRAWAWLVCNRQHVQPEDIQSVFPFIAIHRLFHHSDRSKKVSITDIQEQILSRVSIN